MYTIKIQDSIWSNRKMSRIGKNPINVPSGTQVAISGSKVEVKGALGVLSREIRELVKVNQ